MDSTAAGDRAGGIDRAAPREVNVSGLERWASALGGGALALHGIRRGGAGGALLVLAGGTLVHRGLTGHCPVYRALRTGTAARTLSPVASVPHHQGFKVEQAVTVDRPAEELYRFWRDLGNLPRFMSHLESVRVTGGGLSHWIARGPGGALVEWDATVHNERENELIAWRSLGGADVPNAGSVWFRPAPCGRGTEVKVTLEYKPPAGAIGAAVARLLGEDPDRRVREDLERFKRMMESGRGGAD